MKKYIKPLPFLCVAAGVLWAGCQKAVQPTGLAGSPSGALSRYDLVAADYDVQPVAAFTASYNGDGRIVNLFQKYGQGLSSFALAYNGDQLQGAVANDQGTQIITYDQARRPLRVDYTSITDTGKIVYAYDTGGKLVSLTDSVKMPLKLAQIYQYQFVYDAKGDNVVKVIKNRLDLEGRATTVQYTLYAFDDKPNPFAGFPFLHYSLLLPGEAAALVNKNNIISSQIVGTIADPSDPGSVPVYDTITVYKTSRAYTYTAKGYPAQAKEIFNDVQFNFSGNRTFKYEY